MKKIAGIGILLATLITGGCSFILGKEDAMTQQGLTFRFIETLRNETSLRGEALREVAFNTDPKTTLQQPNAVFADAFRVYVIDAMPARVFVFDRGERKVTILDGTAPPAANYLKLLAPAGIAVDAAGTIFVSDSQEGRVFGCDRNGRLLYVIGQMGELGFPSGVAVDERRSRLYVADTHSRQVKVFSPTGDRLFEIGASGKSDEDFTFPGALALDRNGNLYVLDTVRRRVHLYDPDAKFIKSFSLSGTMPGYAIKPKGLAIDSDGHLYVTDSVSNNILLFDREGIFLFTWGRTGALSGEFWTPSGIFIDADDHIYIADRTNGRVQMFQYVR